MENSQVKIVRSIEELYNSNYHNEEAVNGRCHITSVTHNQIKSGLWCLANIVYLPWAI